MKGSRRARPQGAYVRAHTQGAGVRAPQGAYVRAHTLSGRMRGRPPRRGRRRARPLTTASAQCAPVGTMVNRRARLHRFSMRPLQC
jgi:hypothetical protein